MKANSGREEVSEMNNDEIKIIEAILNSSKVHYSDIANLIGKSRKTIAKYLDNIADYVEHFDVSLIRKRNVGIYFEGNISKLSESIQENNILKFNIPKQRSLDLLTELLITNKAITVQELADKFFISRSTLENNLKAVKGFLNKFGASLLTTKEGIVIVASEREKRRLMSELISLYWGDDYLNKEQKLQMKGAQDVSTNINVFFSPETLIKVLNALNQFKQISGLKMSDYEYQSLAIHLTIAIERIKRNEVIKSSSQNSVLEKNTLILIKVIEKEFGIKLPKDEKQYLNIHILTIQSSLTTSKQDEDKQLKNNNVSLFLTASLKQFDSTLIKNLTIHLIPALKRLSLGLTIGNPYTSKIKKYFTRAYNEVVDLGIKIKNAYGISLNDDELAYIALHIEAFNERNNKVMTVALVCSTGLGTARLLEQRIKKQFSNQIKISRVVSVQEIKERPVSEDLVISTINIKLPNVPLIVVSPFLDENGIRKINGVISKFNNCKTKPEAFMSLINPKYIFLNDKKITRNRVIKKLTDALYKDGFVRTGIGQAAIKRGEMASTAINIVAVPHAPIRYVNKSVIAIYIDKKKIEWQDKMVKIVFFLALNQEIKPHIEEIYSYFDNILEDKKLLKRISESNSVEEVIALLREGEC